MGLLALPAMIAISHYGEKFGKFLAETFYDSFTETANWAAESLAPVLANLMNDVVGNAANIANTLANFVAEIYEEVSDLVAGSDGLFGLNGPIFGEDGPLHAVAELIQNGEAATADGTWFFEGFDAVMLGTADDDVLAHSGWGEIYGDDGDDVLVGWIPIFKAMGDLLYEDPEGPVSLKDDWLTLDGGKGNDWIITLGGENAWTIGGEGRDWIFNTSANGVIFGDTIDGLVQGVGDPLTWSEYDQLETPDNSDNIWWWGNTTMWDPRKGDVLKFFGYPLVGGTNDVGYFFGRGIPALQSATTLASVFNPIFFDYFFPFFNYYIDRENGSLYVANLFSVFFGMATGMSSLGADTTATADDTDITGVMTFKNYDEAYYSFWGADLADAAAESLATGNSDLLGDMSMLFKYANPALALFALLPGFPGGLNTMLPMIDDMLTRAAAATLIAKAAGWSNGTDPLILDLDGDGIETIDINTADVWFDLDNDLFGEKTGWLSGDDGFLVRDLDGDGRIGNVAEMFGGPGLSGLGVLAAFDANGDGKIDMADLIWLELQVWRDRDGDGQTDAGELVTLDALGIVSLSVNGTQVGVSTPQGTLLDKVADFTWSNGSIGRMFDAIFEVNDVDSHFGGEAGLASWLGVEPIGARGFGQVADLAIAMSNDFDLAAMVQTAAASLTVPDLLDMRHKAGAALGQWGFTQEQTRELAPVLLSADGMALLDRAIWVEDATGGFWQRASGSAVLAADGAVIARPTLEQVLAQTGGTWQVEQVFSPSTRAEAVQHRTEVPYLVQIVDGRAVVLDFGVQNADGSWRLASGSPVLNTAGIAIAVPTVADILAQAATVGREWRQEEIGHNPLAGLDVDQIGVRQIDGHVTDYTVQITDDLGSFYIWASILDAALAVQHKNGTVFGFNLRGKAVDFATLDIVDSDDDSGERVELLTPGQFNFALQLSGITFDPAMLAGTHDRTVGVIAYSVNASGDISLSDTSYVSGIQTMIDLLDPVLDQYITVSRAFALRMAFQGGLAEYFPGIAYDAAKDQFHATTDRELAPMFVEIFRDAPDGAVPATLYLQKWHQILSVMYPDYVIAGSGNLFGQTLSLDQRYILQMMLPAYQTIGIDIDLKGAMYALGINQDRLLQTPANATTLDGTSGVDFFVVGDGAQLYRGGMGGDVYFVGQTFGNLTIQDIDHGAADELRFSNVTSAQVIATRIGQDLILTAQGQTGQITVKNHFLGELNPRFGNVTDDTALKAIIFADGVLWDQFRIAFEVSDPKDTNDVIVGSGALDVLDGGKGSDVLQGGTGGDIYLFRVGDGQDVVQENNTRPTLPGKGGLDFVQFMGDITADDLRLTRAGESDDLLIQLMNKDGTLTGDTILVKDQFGGMRFNLGAFLGGIDPSLALDYIAPNMIEKFLFEDGSWLDFGQISQKVLENAATAGSDLIYGFIDADTITGAAGDDLLVGREGGDTYLFGRGDGVDEVEDGDMSVKLFGSPDDVLTFEDGVTWGDLEFLRTGGSDTLSLRILGSNDTVILSEQERAEPFIGFINLIEQINFGGGISWTYGELFQHFINLAQTSGDDTVYGFHTSDVLQGGLGNDRMEGRGGSDHYAWTAGDGTDIILDTSGDSDEVNFGALASTDVDILRNGTALIFRVKASGETLTIEDQYLRADKQGRAIEAFVFTDRTMMFTQLNPEDIDAVGTSASEIVRGSQFAETLDGLDGDDTLEGGSDGDTYRFDAGYGSDVIIDRQERASWAGRFGTERETTDTVRFGPGLTFATAVFTPVGNDLVITFTNRPDVLTIRNQFRSINDEVETFHFDDRIISSAGIEELLAITGGNRGDNNLIGNASAPNALDGRQGFDTLTGGTAADSYAFGIGYDFDNVVERADNANVLDRVVFGEGVTADQLILRRDGLDLLIDLGNAEDVLRIVGGLGTTTVERFSFADGTVKTLAEIRAQMLVGTESNNRLEGFANSADRLIGGAGTDELIGGTGNDTYVFGHGDGQDSVLETGTGTANAADRIEFGTGVTRDQVTFETVGADLVIRLAPGNDSLVILGGADATAATTVEQFAFADGTILTMADVQTLMFATRGNGSSDFVDGSTIAAGLSLKPGAGFDAVTLPAGSTYVFAKGDGLDHVAPSYSSNKTNTILVEDYTSSEVEVRRPKINGQDAMITFPATGEAIYLVNAVGSFGRNVTITFADGVVWTQSDLVQAMVDGQISQGNDRVIGPLSLGATYEGGQGDDEYDSNTGIDTWIFNRGDGRDLIVDDGGANEVLHIRGYTAADMRVHRSINDIFMELVISFVGTDDEIVLRHPTAYLTNWNGVNTIQFSEGPAILVESLLAATQISASDSHDMIIDGATTNTLEGGRGDDTIVGNQGNDRYVYSRGDGVDYIDDVAGSLLTLKGFIPSEVQLVQQPGFAGLVIRLADGGEIWTKNANTMASITFDNGTVWQQADFAGLIVATRSGSDMVLTGTASADTLVSGLGDDLLDAGGGSDTYVFARGFGHDRVAEEPLAQSLLVVQGYQSTEAQFLRNPADPLALSILFAATGERIDFAGALAGPLFNGQSPIASIAFDDVTLSFAQVLTQLHQAAATTGDDHLQGTAFGEVLAGGLGDDLIMADAGADTITFTRGDGADEIRTTGADANEILVLHGYAPADLIVEHHPWDAQGLVLRFAGSADRIDWRGTSVSDPVSLQQIQFADTGAALTLAQVLAQLPPLASASASTGADTLVGSGGDDLLTPLSGADVIDTKAGEDTISFGTGDGADMVFGKREAVAIVDMNGLYSPDGHYIVALRDVAPDDLRIEAVGGYAGAQGYVGDLRLVIISTGDSLLVQNGGSVLNRIEFANGTIWTETQITAAIVSPTVESLDHVERLITSDAAVIDLSAPANDLLRLTQTALAVNFTYSRLGGHDVIAAPMAEAGFASNDTLVLSDITSTEIDVRILPSSEGRAMLITFGDSANSLRILMPYDFLSLEGNGPVIGSFQFADAITLTWQDMLDRAATLALSDPAAGLGSLTYDRSIDSGTHFLLPAVAEWTDIPRSLTLAGVGTSDVTYALRGGDLVITVAADAVSGLGAGDIIVPAFANLTGFQITLDGGAVVDLAAIQAGLALQMATSGDDTVFASLLTDAAGDVVAAGAGDDLLIMTDAYGSTVAYARGDGHDVIVSPHEIAQLSFAGIAQGDVTVLLQGDDIVLHIAPSAPMATDGGSVRLLGLSVDLEQGYSSVQINFGASVVWSAAQLWQHVAVAGTSGADVLAGATKGDLYDLRGGDDFVQTAGFNDSYVYRNGDGHDVTVESGENPDVATPFVRAFAALPETGPLAPVAGAISLSATNFWATQRVVDDFGTVGLWLGANVVTGLAATGLPLVADAGNLASTVTFADGITLNVQDLAEVFADGGAAMAVHAGDIAPVAGILDLSDLSVVDVSLYSDAGATQISFLHLVEGSPVYISLPLFADGVAVVDHVTFAGGITAAVSTMRAGTLVAQSIEAFDIGTGTAPTISAGQDVLEMPDLLASDLQFLRDGEDLLVQIVADPGRGILSGSLRMVDAFLTRAADGFSLADSRIIDAIQFGDGSALSVLAVLQIVLDGQGTATANVITGTNRADTLRGGAGDDLLDGRDGLDTYLYARGDGSDEIAARRDGTLSWSAAGAVETLRLAGINTADVSARLEPGGIRLIIAQTAPVAGDGGSVLLRSNDYAAGGNDYGAQQVVFDDGTVWSLDQLYAKALDGLVSAGDDSLLGSPAADTLIGTAGDDTLSGGAGDDTYVYTRGDGSDVIYETARSGIEANTLRLIGVDPSEVVLRAGAGSNLNVVIPPSAPGGTDGGYIAVIGGLTGASNLGIGRILFDDGTIWSSASFATMVAAMRVTNGSDYLTGSSSADTLAGAKGDDFLLGGAGNDTYRFARGDGYDQIDDSIGTNDVLEITGYDRSEVSFDRRGFAGQDLVIHLGTNGDTIVVSDGLIKNSSNAVDRIVFMDMTGTDRTVTIGTIWAEMNTALITDGDDVLTGLDHYLNNADTMRGGKGNDLLDGGAGGDTYLYATGDGDDRISDRGTSVGDRLVLDINPNQVVYALRFGPTSNDLVLRLTGPNDRIILTESLGTTTEGVEEIQFADGTIWTRATMREKALQFAQTTGDDAIWGFAGAETYDMGTGNDTVMGGLGDDTFVVQRGDGQDRITETAATGSLDQVTFLDYVSTEVSVERLFKGSASVQFHFLSSGDTLIVDNVLASNGSGVERFAFSDGVTWTAADILLRLDNTAPEALADGYFAVIADQTLTLTAAQLLRNDFDPDGDAIMVVRADGGADGVAEIDASGNIIFHSNPGFSGPTQFSYTISDGRGGFDTGLVDVRVRPVAQARDDAGFVLTEDGSLHIRAEQLLANDADGDRMIIGQVLNAVGGTAVLSSTGDITFVAAANFTGEAQFTYIANTPEGGVGQGVVRITVTPVNDAPTATTDGPYVLNENTSIELTVAQLLANDSDIDSPATSLELVAVAGTSDVSVQLTATGDIIATPRADFFGAGYFTYTLRDASGATSTGRVNLTVNPVNDAPVLGADSFDTAEDFPIFVTFADLLGNDSDPDGDTLTVERVQGAVGGHATLQENGVAFVPNGNFHGTAGFRYVVSDGQGAETSVFVTVNVASVNDEPAARADIHTMPGRDYLRGLEDQPITIAIADLMLNDSDIDGDVLTFQTASSAVGGTITLPGDGTIIFTPDSDFWGEATFSYVVADGNSGVGAAEVRMFFANVDDAAPVAVADILTVEEDTVTYIPLSVLLGNDYDIDRDPLTVLTIGTTLATSHGSLVWHDANTLKFTPGLNETRTTEFFYTVSDGIFAPTRGRIEINITPINDEPIAGDDSGFVTERGVPLVLRIADLMANDADVEATALTFAGVDAHSAGTLEIVNNQFIVMHLGADFTGPVTLDYIVTDGSLTDTARVTALVAPSYDGSIEGSALVDLLIGTDGTDSISGLAGNDIIRAEAGDDVIFGGDGGDLLYGGLGTDRVDYTASDSGVRVSLATRFGQGGDAQGDELFSIEALTGSGYGDTIDGGAGDNALDGGAGHDLIGGLDGADTLLGGTGNDTLAGGAGDDLIDGGAGNDTADYTTSTAGVSVSLTAGTAAGGDAAGDVLTGVENLTGSDQADVLEGDGGANHLSGGRGADTLLGGAGDDVLTGGRGADVISGGDGIDTADYALSDAGVVVNMADGGSGGGDAAGDVFTSIEIVQGSYHGDALTGDGTDNRLRGGVGADTIDGGAGFDTADYATAGAAVAVDLGTGQGTAGEAAGDQLTQIEKLLGSDWADSLSGGIADETFDGGLGNDALAGGGGSDSYLFGFGAGSDVLAEADMAGIDRVVLQSPVLRSDVSLVREGDDLLIELENTGGFLTDTLRITGHFSGATTGVEEIAFAEGMVWDRAAIDNLARLGRFNAANDLWLFGTEDEVAVIDPALLLVNDASEGVADLELLSVQGENGATASIDVNGLIQFQGAQDANGDAFFTYTVRDAFGRESTARVEVNLAPVNDAPVAANDGPFYGFEDQILTINIAQLLGNDTDIDGDSLRIIALEPLLGVDGEPLYSGGQWSLTHGRGQISGAEIRFEPRTDHFGLAGFRYLVSDDHGGTAYGEVQLTFQGVNDAPRGDDIRTIRLGMVNTLLLSDLMSNDTDPEGDSFVFGDIFQGFNGTATLVQTAQGMAVQVVANALGDAGFSYSLTDSKGETGIITVDLTVRPLNDPPTAGNDSGLVTLEDQTILIDPASLLANDHDQNGDTLTISALDQFARNGRVEWTTDGMIAFIPRANFNGVAGFEYTISDGEGGFDTAWVSLTIEPRNDAPVTQPDLLVAVEDQPLLILLGELIGNDFDPDGDGMVLENVSFEGLALWGNQTETRPAEASLAADAAHLGAVETASLTMAGGAALPAWLTFDAQTLTITGTAPEGFTGALNLDLVLTLPAGMGGDSLTQTVVFAADEISTLATGVAIDLPYLLLETQPRSLFADLMQAGAFGEMPSGQVYNPSVHGYPAGIWTATDPSGRALTDWLEFDAATQTLSIRADALPQGAGATEVRIAYTTVIPYLASDVTDTPNGGFAFDVVIDPAAGIDPAINQMLHTQAFFAAQGLFALPLADRAGLTATLETGAPLPAWISFDPETLAFTGTASAGDYVGALVVRIALPACDGRPAVDLITEVTVDPVLQQSQGTSGFSAVLTPEGILVTTPEDFDGSYILSYTIADPAGEVSTQPGRIVVNVADMRDLPDAIADQIVLGTAEFIDIPLSQLLANDRDLDGDAIRITGISAAGLGTLTVVNTVVLDAAAQTGLVATGATYSARMLDGSALPAWISVDPVSGQLTAQVPLGAHGPLAMELVRVLDGVTSFAPLSPIFNGNAGAVLRYVAAPGDAATDGFTYTLTDDHEGSVTGQVTLVLNRAPKVVNDVVAGVEDTDLVLPVAAVLANDSDLDGDALTLTAVSNAENGTVSLLDGVITFAPTANFDGVAGFDYTVSDGRGGVSVAHVTINVASTNHAPEAGPDSFATDEDTGFVITEAQLMANDSDADGDVLTFLGFDPHPDFNLSQRPDGSWLAMPGANLNGTFTLTYRISDGRLETTGNIQVTVAPVNDVPILHEDQVIQAVEDTPLTIDMAALLANDIDPEGDSFAVVEVYDPLNGSVSLVDGVVTFTPRADYHGPAGFLYVIRDAHGAEVTATAEILVAPAVDAPIPVLDRLTMAEDGSLLMDPALLLANDYNPDADALVFLGFTSAGVTTAPNGLYRYTPPADFNGVVALTYQVTNGSGVVVDGQVQVTVTPVGDAPVAGTDTLAMVEDQPLVITAASLLANDSDVDIQSIAIVDVTDAVGVAVVLLPNGDIQITPDLNRTANGSFTYTLRDSSGLTSQGSVTVTLSPVNDAPLLAAPMSDRLATEETAFSIALQTGLFSDPDGNALTYSLTLADGSALPAWLQFNPLTQVMTGTPPTNLFGDVMLRLTVSDGSQSVSDDFALRIQGTNDAPVLLRPVVDVALNATGQAIRVGQAFSFAADLTAFADPDGTPLGYGAQLATGGPLPAWLTFNGTSFSGTPPTGANGTLDIRLLANDGGTVISDVFTLTIAPAINVPYDAVITAPAAGGVVNGTAGRDQIIGGAGKDNFFDLAGNDDVYGGAGDDNFNAGAGADLYDGGAGVDKVSYTANTSGVTVNMFSPADSTGIAQGDRFVSVEWLYGTNYNDILITNGLSRIYAMAGDDFIRDSRDTQTIWGGAGRDWFQFIAGDQIQDRIADFQIGQDIIDLSLWGVTSLSQLTFTERLNGDGTPANDLIITYMSDSIRVDGFGTAQIAQFNAGSFHFLDPVQANPNQWAGAIIDGTAQGDNIDMQFRDAEGQGISGGGQVILAGDGSDTIRDGIGNDQVYGGNGDDMFLAGAGSDVYYGGAGRNQLSYADARSGVLLDMDTPANSQGAAAGDTWFDIEYAHGSDYSDVILSQGVARVFGRAGDDYIRDGAGGQMLYGGAGADTFAMIAADGAVDRLSDFQIGQDKIDLTAWGVTSFDQLVFSERVSGQGALMGDVMIRFGNEQVRIDGMTAANIAQFTTASFVLATPVPLAPAAAPTNSANRLASPDIVTQPTTAPQTPLQATLALAASAGDSISFAPVNPASVTAASGSAQLSSLIAGDALAPVGTMDHAPLAPDALSGTLIDPQTSVTAFLSPTQLAALDGDQFSFY